MPDHYERCPEAAACRFCNTLVPRDQIDDHEGNGKCPEAVQCKFCQDILPKDIIDDHVAKFCPKAIPGVNSDEQVDPRGYYDKVAKNAKKLKNKNSNVIVEDDYIEPNDFRDPGKRKLKKDNSVESGPKNPYNNGPSKYSGSKRGSVSPTEGKKSGTNEEPSVSIE
jgi:hypothetical protein